MRAVIQRVLSASVEVGGKTVGSCKKGLFILLGVKKGDGEEDAELLASKISKLRIFEDENQKMNLSVCDIGGEILIVSNFTLCADCRRGNRPDFFGAEAPSEAKRLYEFFVERAKDISGLKTETGVFGADMKIFLENDGPVTIVIDSDELKKPRKA